MTKKKKKKQEEEAPPPLPPAIWRPKRVADEEQEDVVPLWLITFTDIMALMLTFFVLLYSMSVPVEEKWEDFTSALNKGISRFESPKWYQGPQDTINIDRMDFSRALDLKYLESLVNGIVEKNERLSNVVVIPQRGRLVLSLPSNLLFESGKAEVTAEGQRALFALGGALSRIRNRIEVIGHADPRPIGQSNTEFNSNWELSLARATHVGAVLKNVGYGRTILPRGLSSSRYDQLPEDIEEEERLNLSRRVDIVIMEDDGHERMLFQ